MVRPEGLDDNGSMARRQRPKQYRTTFIRQWREFRGLSQERLAERIGKSPGLLSQIENAKGPYTQETLEAIAAALGCEPVDLLVRDPSDPEGIWTVWEALAAPERHQAIEHLKIIKRRIS